MSASEVIETRRMDYDDIAAYFLIPTGDTPPTPVLAQSDARRLRDSIEPIATIGWWSRAAAHGTAGLGHGFFDGYVWGRAAALGDSVASEVVVAAFGVFEPTMLAATLQHGRSISSAAAVLGARSAGASEGLRTACAAAHVPEAIVAAFGSRLLEALTPLDGLGRPLFGALRAQPTPDDTYGRAWRAAELVREHRGDGHVAALVASGLSVVEANVFTELWLGFDLGEYSATRGFSPDVLAQAAGTLRHRGWLTNDNAVAALGRTARDAIEAATDESQRALIAQLGDELDSVIANADTISQAILAAHAAPADPRKRAAG